MTEADDGSGAGGEGTVSGMIRRIAEAVTAEDGPTVVALLAEPTDPETSWRQAAGVCDAVAERRRTLVVNLTGAGSGFDAHLGAEAGEGLEGVRAGRIKLSEAPVRVEGRRFLYLPAGRRDATAAEDAPLPLEDAAVVGAVEKLAEKIGQAGGVLLLYLTPDALPDRRAADLVDGAIRLAGAVGVGGVTTLGRLDVDRRGPDESVEAFLGLPDDPEEGATDTDTAEVPPPTEEPEPDVEPEGEPGPDGPSPGATPPAGTRPSAEAAGGTEPPAADGGEEPAAPAAASGDGVDAAPGHPEERATARVVGGSGGEGGGSGWRRHRRSPGVPWGRILVAAALVVGLAAGWWYLADRAAPDASGPGAPAPGERVAAADEGDGGANARAGDDASAADARGEGADAGSETTEARALVERSAELPYSVLVASYGSWPAARERLDRWSGEDGAPVLFAAPTPVGERVYWRVLAGALADRESGRALNRRLVSRGWKGEATDWEVRPTSLAFLLSVEADREAAGERVSELRDRDVPAYALPAAPAGDTAWAVWAGAYESRDAASGLGRRLRRTGVEAELITRRGATGRP